MSIWTTIAPLFSTRTSRPTGSSRTRVSNETVCPVTLMGSVRTRVTRISSLVGPIMRTRGGVEVTRRLQVVDDQLLRGPGAVHLGHQRILTHTVDEARHGNE